MVIYFFTAIAIIAVVCCIRLILLMLMPFIKFLLNWQNIIKIIREQFIETAPERFAKGKILWADKKRLNYSLEEFLRGATLEENYNCLIQDLKSMTKDEKMFLITHLDSESNITFTEKELAIIDCILSKIIFDFISDFVEKLIAQPMSKEVQTLSNFNSYYKKYESLKFSMFSYGKALMVNYMQRMFNCKDKKSLSSNFSLINQIFDKYTNALKEYIKNENDLLETLMTKPQDNLIEKIDNLNESNLFYGER